MSNTTTLNNNNNPIPHKPQQNKVPNHYSEIKHVVNKAIQPSNQHIATQNKTQRSFEERNLDGAGDVPKWIKALLVCLGVVFCLPCVIAYGIYDLAQPE